MNNGFKLKKFRLTALLLAAVAVFILGASGCAEQRQTKAQETQQRLFDYQQSQLANGMKVITLEDFSCPIVAVQVMA